MGEPDGELIKQGIDGLGFYFVLAALVLGIAMWESASLIASALKPDPLPPPSEMAEGEAR